MQEDRSLTEEASELSLSVRLPESSLLPVYEILREPI